MNVRELIERLQRCDPDLPVEIACTFGPHGRQWFREDIVSVGRYNGVGITEKPTVPSRSGLSVSEIVRRCCAEALPVLEKGVTR